MATSVGTVWVDVRFNVGDAAAQLQRSLAAATGGAGLGAAAAAAERTWSQSLGAIGTKAQAVGRQMTTMLTLPLALIGKSAVSSFKEFDTAMTRIQALNQVSAEQTEAWRGQVRELGRQYGVAGEEAAEALYFITSSGQEGTRAMETLNVAVKASAVGLGETKVVADVLTSAMSAYQDEALSAAHAGDILASAVHYGKGEAEDLAGALSQVIPIAANLGVGFDEMAGAMAAMTLSGTSADQAATQLRGLFNTLQDMPPIAEKALMKYTGLNAETLRLNISSQGLVPTLKQIYDGFGDNTEALAEVFGNIRALTGVFNLFGQNTEQTLSIIKNVTEASGDLNDAWEITAQSKSKKLEIAMNNVHDAMIGLGGDIIPIITPIVNGIGAVAQAFGGLPGPLKGAAIAFGLFTAAAGPALMMFGSMARGVTALANTFPNLTAHLATEVAWLNNGRLANTRLVQSMGGLSSAMGVAGIAVGSLAAGYMLWQRSMNEAREAGDALAASVAQGKQGGGIAGDAKVIEDTRNAIKSLEEEASASNLSRWNPLDLDYFAATGEEIDKLRASLEKVEARIKLANELAPIVDKPVDAIRDWLAAEATQARFYANAKDAQKAMTEAFIKGDEGAKKLQNSTTGAADAMGSLYDRAKATADTFQAFVDAENKVKDAQKGLADAHQEVLDAQQDYADAQKEVLAAGRKITEAEKDQADAVLATRDARLKLLDAQRELNDALAGPSEEEKLDVEGAKLGLQQAQKSLRGKFDDPLDRRRAQLDVRRARLDVQRAAGAHDKRIEDARKGVADAEKSVNDAVDAELAAKDAVIQARDDKAEASRNQARAHDDIRIAQEGVTVAEANLLTATMDLEGKQALLNGELINGTVAGNSFLTFLENLKAKYPEMGDYIDKYAERFRGMWQAAGGKDVEGQPPSKTAADVLGGSITATEGNNLTGFAGAGQWFKDHPFKRAAGGPLSTGQLSTVNERGMPELWSAGGKQWLLPTTQGQVTPLKPLDVPVTAKGHDGVTIGGDIIVQGAEQPVATAYEVRRQLRVKTRTGGRI
jgi:TP901 family phage tail tape measure protein